MDVREQTARLLFLCCVVLIGVRAQALELNGVAAFSELGEETYLAGLYIDWRSSEPADYFSDYRERKMEVRFSSSVSRRRWVNSWMQSIAINNSRQHLEETAEELSYVLSTFEGNLFRGDQVEIHYQPEAGTEFRLNGHVLASGHSAAIFNLFVYSWLGPVPPSSHFRASLLGVESSPDSTRFVTLQPAVERIEAVGSWASVSARDGEMVESEPVVALAATAPVPLDELPENVEATGETVPEFEAVPESGPGRVFAVTDAASAAPETPADLSTTVSAAIADDAPSAEDALGDKDAFEDEGDELDLSVAAILGQRDYLSQLIRDVYSNIRYPDRAVRRNYEGDVRMRLIIERDGALANMQMVQGARYEILNDEAERAVWAATPFAAIPAVVGGDRIEVELPINFRLE